MPYKSVSYLQKAVVAAVLGSSLLPHHTADALRAIIKLTRAPTSAIGDVRSWATDILHTKTRKLPLLDPKRKKFIAQLEAIATRSAREYARRGDDPK